MNTRVNQASQKLIDELRKMRRRNLTSSQSVTIARLVERVPEDLRSVAEIGIIGLVGSEEDFARVLNRQLEKLKKPKDAK